MRIVHFSDWHWGFEKLPEADLYVCTGDQYCNYSWDTMDKLHERRSQLAAAIKLAVTTGGFQQFLGSPGAFVVCVRGNHDFAPLAPYFAGCNLVHEFLDNEVREVLGLKITGHRGIPFINGDWSDEESRADLKDRMRRMPPADLYLTHYPPAGVGLDGSDTAHYGLDAMADHLVYRSPPWEALPPHQLHCFGHVHECGGRTARAGDILFSNAATTINVIEGSPQRGWHQVETPGRRMTP